MKLNIFHKSHKVNTLVAGGILLLGLSIGITLAIVNRKSLDLRNYAAFIDDNGYAESVEPTPEIVTAGLQSSEEVESPNLPDIPNCDDGYRFDGFECIPDSKPEKIPGEEIEAPKDDQINSESAEGYGAAGGGVTTVSDDDADGVDSRPGQCMTKNDAMKKCVKYGIINVPGTACFQCKDSFYSSEGKVCAGTKNANGSYDYSYEEATEDCPCGKVVEMSKNCYQCSCKPSGADLIDATTTHQADKICTDGYKPIIGNLISKTVGYICTAQSNNTTSCSRDSCDDICPRSCTFGCAYPVTCDKIHAEKGSTGGKENAVAKTEMPPIETPCGFPSKWTQREGPFLCFWRKNCACDSNGKNVCGEPERYSPSGGLFGSPPCVFEPSYLFPW